MEDNPSLENLKAKSNQELMRLAQQDIKGAYDIIYGRLYGQLFNMAWKTLRNATDAEDAAERALATGYIKRNKFLFLSKVETWLTRILINKSIDIIRENGGVRPEGKTGITTEGPEEAETEEPPAPRSGRKTTGSDTQAAKETRLMLIFLEECIKELPEEEKMSLELREIYDIPYKEITKIAKERFGHSSLGNIKNKTDSAKIKVKKCVERKLSSCEIILKNKHRKTV